jgi:DNA invertase Pin-like site-specific DNA recombinase
VYNLALEAIDSGNAGPKAMKIIAYYRVSPKRQEESGLGLEAQKTAIEGFAQASRGTIAAAYVEVESGRKADRPKLALALAHAKRSKATLVVAKLDRLARNVAFLSAIMDSGVDFVACDNPHANRLTIHILAAVAEDEARRISERTKAALGAAKARGTKLGSARPGHWKGREDRRLAGSVAGAAAAAELHRKAASEAYTDLAPIVAELRDKGCTQAAIADELNKLGHTTRRGKAWNHVQVGRLLRRMAE